ncbi:MAG: tetratricopeptide repeat protein, partial [Chloroflexota bacterium]
MPGNREVYETEMNAGHEAAWNQQWSEAANHYGRALTEFSEDPEAHLNLGFALLMADRLDEAFKVYSRAHQLAPEDPIPLEKSADVLERMGRLREAAQQYASVADVYLKHQRDIDKAISNWERATELTPGLVALHAKLAQAYRRLGNKKQAIYQYMMLAYNLNNNGDRDRAMEAAKRALALNKRNVEAINALSAIESGSQIQRPTPVEDETSSRVTSSNEGGIDWSELQLDTTTLSAVSRESDPLGPMGEAMNDALSALATAIMMSGGFDAGGVEALQAMELQRQGLHSEAINAYQEAARNMNHPALSMNLGALLLLSEQADAAIRPLTTAADDSDLKAGAYHALGQAYVNQDKFKRGLNYLLQTAEMVDLAMVDAEDERQQVHAIYEETRLAAERRGENDQTLAAVCRRVQRLLSGNEWERRLVDNRHQMAEAQRDGGGSRILEFLAQDIAEGVTESVAKIDRYIRQGLYTLALDEAHYAMEKSPTYLPIHVRMAEVMMLEGRVRQAINKYNTVAKAYRVRGENGRAASILFEVLETAPLDIDVRRNLIGLLEAEERWEDALEQYVELADTYRQLGNLDSARNTYAEAERLADRVEANIQTRIRIKHAIADIDQLKLDVRRSQRVYEDIIALSPTDEKARRGLVEINLQMGNQIEGIKQLDGLLRLFAKNKDVKKILSVLQALVQSYPDDGGLRSRLAAIYRQLKRNEDAVEQLEKLAHIQLDAGLEA